MDGGRFEESTLPGLVGRELIGQFETAPSLMSIQFGLLGPSPYTEWCRRRTTGVLIRSYSSEQFFDSISGFKPGSGSGFGSDFAPEHHAPDREDDSARDGTGPAQETLWHLLIHAVPTVLPPGVSELKGFFAACNGENAGCHLWRHVAMYAGKSVPMHVLDEVYEASEQPWMWHEQAGPAGMPSRGNQLADGSWRILREWREQTRKSLRWEEDEPMEVDQEATGQPPKRRRLEPGP